MSDTAYCGSCGSEISAGAKFCRHCGSPQAQFTTETEQITPPQEPASQPPAAQPPTLPPDLPPAADPPLPPEPVDPVPPTRSYGPPSFAISQPTPPAPEPVAQPPEPQPAPEQPPSVGPPPQATAQPPPVGPPPHAGPQPYPGPPPHSGQPYAGQPPHARAPYAGAPHGHTGASQAAERIDRVSPGAGELAGRMASGLQAPGVAAAGLAGLVAAAVAFAFGLLVAIATPADAVLAFELGFDEASIVTEACRQMVSSLQLPLSGFGFGPLLFLLVPLGGAALGAATQASRTRAMPVGARLAWAAATGVPFALVMLVAAIVASTGEFAEAPIFGAFLLGLLWGAVGGLIGARFAIRRENPDAFEGILPRWATAPLAALAASLRPLALAIAIAAALGTGAWLVQSIRDVDAVTLDQGILAPAVQAVVFSADIGVHWVELGVLSEFGPEGESEGSASAAGPIPIEDFSKLDTSDEGEFGLFDYQDAMPVWLFIPLVALLIAVPAFLAVNSGFALTRAMRAKSLGLAAAWGALTGPIWAVAMAILGALADKIAYGHTSGDTSFVAFLLGGAVLGAGGGLLGFDAANAPPKPAPLAGGPPQPQGPPQPYAHTEPYGPPQPYAPSQQYVPPQPQAPPQTPGPPQPSYPPAAPPPAPADQDAPPPEQPVGGDRSQPGPP